MNLKQPNMIQSTMVCTWEQFQDAATNSTKYVCTAKGVSFHITDEDEVVFEDIPPKVLNTYINGDKMPDFIKNAVEGSAIQLMAEDYYQGVVEKMKREAEEEAMLAANNDMDDDEEVEDDAE